ncbi:MAG: cytochrome c [Phycisphaerales bacterium]|nr:cytochrome c [Phycisphaerales bacterium]
MMRHLIAIPLLTLAVSCAGCDWMPGKPTKAEEPELPSDVLAFTTLYTNNCSGCHGANGTFGAARPMNDPLYLSLASDDYLSTITADGVAHTLMPAFSTANGGGLTPEQIQELLKGMRRNWGGFEIASETPTAPALQTKVPGDAARGRTLFLSHCSACHGNDGTGGAKAGSVVNDSFLALASDQALRSTIICGRRDLGMPDYRGELDGQPVAERQGLQPLTDQGVSDLVAWLISHRQPFPGAPFPTLEAPDGSGTQVP